MCEIALSGIQPYRENVGPNYFGGSNDGREHDPRSSDDPR